jgi:hypothetical protein
VDDAARMSAAHALGDLARDTRALSETERSPPR